jgi:TIR domain
MADVFISYSQQDREKARLIAAFLEAEGYSVWWDTSLLGGENFRKAIMTELGRARATIVLWTESSVHSDWVQSEAGRAHADRKLIPVKAKGVSYKDIPPPFDNMHIESADDREKILAAITAQLAKPQEQASALSRFTKKTRFELLSWFGILGAVVTLTTNLQSVLTLARWARQFLEGWTSVVTHAWHYVLFFLPKVYPSDAVMLTFAGFAIINMIASSARHAVETPRSRTTRAMRVVSIVIASAILSIVFYAAFGKAMMDDLKAAGPEMLDVGYFPFAWATTNIEIAKLVRSTVGPGTVLIVVVLLILMLFFIVIPLLPAAVVYLLLRTTTSFRLSAAALSVRLWRVTAGVCLLVVLNYLSLWVEQQPWALGWSR